MTSKKWHLTFKKRTLNIRRRVHPHPTHPPRYSIVLPPDSKAMTLRKVSSLHTSIFKNFQHEGTKIVLDWIMIRLIPLSLALQYRYYHLIIGQYFLNFYSFCFSWFYFYFCFVVEKSIICHCKFLSRN